MVYENKDIYTLLLNYTLHYLHIVVSNMTPVFKKRKSLCQIFEYWTGGLRIHDKIFRFLLKRRVI